MSRLGLRRLWILALALAWPLLAAARETAPAPPSVVFGRLYAEVELKRVFADSKTFADATPRQSPAAILKRYRPGRSAKALRAFVLRNFDLPPEPAPTPPSAARPPLEAHIAALWPVLARPADTALDLGSRLPLHYPYVVPGGRFREIYYWDSYFTMLGLVQDGRVDLAQALVDNFADLIGRFGHIPNGSRTYYLSRSQPPVFFLMTGLLTPKDPAAGHARYLDALREEYRFWMAGEDRARPGEALGHVVRLPDGAILNRYWDASDTPRDESYREDVTLAKRSGRRAPVLYRELRSAAESGWDFSSRWMADGHSLASLETTSIIPVDLNSLLFGLERAIADGCARTGDQPCAGDFEARAERRQDAMDRYLWNDTAGAYLDYNFLVGWRIERPSAATLYPLFVGAASQDQARRVAQTVRYRLLAPGGLRTTTARTGQQWDDPNGWAPLQWIAVSGLAGYGEAELAHDIRKRWIATVCRTYLETGKLLEKYDVEERAPGGGGEYPAQDGFGWTNGVTLALFPDVGNGRPMCPKV